MIREDLEADRAEKQDLGWVEVAAGNLLQIEGQPFTIYHQMKKMTASVAQWTRFAELQAALSKTIANLMISCAKVSLG